MIRIEITGNTADEIKQLVMDLSSVMGAVQQMPLQTIVSTIETIEEITAEQVVEPVEPTEPDKPALDIDTVRDYLSGLTKSGKGAEVKALIAKYGAKKLTEVNESRFDELMKEAEAIA
jgi:hypothetical protein